ncbi:proteasome regulatory particle subunit [Malassezia arunalokei]|uniref:Proteasome regulatory particle subunit n=1 Tax=Malassezia arunalokei TaxID=1514897 RepID=A0AAJ5Z055_9BASI|nr:proteasome regulatory particle subunit [Malassezia arunalokei]
MDDERMDLGRGFDMNGTSEAEGVKSQGFEQLDVDMDQADDGAVVAGHGHAAQSMEGWVVVVSNIHEEALEDDVLDVFSEYGKVRDLHLNLDRRTGYVKYKTKAEAQSAIEACKQGLTLLEQALDADFAFVQPRGKTDAKVPRRTTRDRSLSPMRQ